MRTLIPLPPPLPARTRFLEWDATPEERIQAAAANHRDRFRTEAIASGGEVGGEDGLEWAATPDGMTIPLPRLTRRNVGDWLDAVLAECRRRGLKSVSVWSLTPSRPRDLGAYLAARGFEWGWRPHWMSLDLRRKPDDFPLPDGLRIAVDDESDWEVDDLPYYSRAGATTLRALAQARPRRTWHFGARLDGKIVGHSLLHVTTGRLGVAGIYSVGVVPDARNQGIGRAVSLAACRFAQALGCRYALLNAATTIYERLGFESLGFGQTWWMHAPVIAAPPPDPTEVAFAEAVGRGDLKTLQALGRDALPSDLDAPLLGGASPLHLAVRAARPASAEWLIAQGATLGVLDVWDLGWKDRAPALLARSPELVTRRSGDWQTTPLHEAVLRGDAELARILLAADPDLGIEDTQFHSTPLGWARHLGQTEIAALIGAHQASSKR